MIILILLCSKLLSQNIDSIEHIINSNKNDIVLINSYYNLGKAYNKQKKYDKSIDAYSKSLELSVLKSDFNFIAKNLIEIGYIYNYYKNNKDALKNFQQVYFYEIEIQDKKLLAEAANQLGAIYYYLSNFDKSLFYFEKALYYNQIIKNELEAAQALTNIAVIWTLKGKTENSLDYYTKALKVFEKAKNKKGIAYVYNNIGLIYKDMNNYEQALDFFNKSLKMKFEYNDTSSYGDSYNNIGVLYEKVHNRDSALFYFSKSYEAHKYAKNEIGIAKALNNIGTIFKQRNNFKKALEYFNKSLNIRLNIKDYANYSSSYINLGEIYEKLGNSDLALDFLNKAAITADTLKTITNQILSYKALYDYYSNKKNYEKALENYIIYSNLQDTLLNQKKISQISELQIVYETEQNQQKMKLLQSDNLAEKQKVLNTRYITIAAVLFLCLVIFSISMYFRQQKLRNENKTISLEQRLLRSQMNPHFIFNSLIAIQSYIFENNPMFAGKYLADFAKLIRLILENSREEYITFEKEIETLKFYLNLQKLRFENKFDFYIEIDNNIDIESVMIPPMFAQPIIENAIEHGIRHLKSDGKINIKFSKVENLIKMEIKDNGTGIKESKNSIQNNHTSFALKILQERLDQYLPKAKSKITIESSEQGTNVSFFSPLIYL